MVRMRVALTATSFALALAGPAAAQPAINLVCSPGINKFNALLAEWRAKGDLEGLDLRLAEPDA